MSKDESTTLPELEAKVVDLERDLEAVKIELERAGENVDNAAQDYFDLLALNGQIVAELIAVRKELKDAANQ